MKIKMDIVLFLWILVLGLSCCGNKSKEAQVKTKETATSVQQTDTAVTDQVQFPFPELPQVMTDPNERRSYLVLHYWDEYNFADTALLHRAEVTEQGVVNYIALLAEHPSDEEVKRALTAFCRQMTPHDEARSVLSGLMEKYLYDPQSPLRNDVLYVRFLDELLQCVPAGSDARRERWMFNRRLAARNNPGEAAIDFTYRLVDSRRGTLRATPTGGSPLILFFYDPGCENCHATLLSLKADNRLAEAVAVGRVTVLAVYTEGDDAVWRSGLDEMPDGWIVANDDERVKQESLYDLRAMPSLYLLDADKRVLLKDASPERILQEIAQ